MGRDRGSVRLQAERLFEAGRMSPSEVARLIFGAGYNDGQRANLKRMRNAWLKERGLPIPHLENKPLDTLSRIPRTTTVATAIERSAANSQTQFPSRQP